MLTAHKAVDSRADAEEEAWKILPFLSQKIFQVFQGELGKYSFSSE